MKLKQKKKIINNSNIKNRTGFIFMGTSLNKNSKKELLINKTKIFKKKTHYFELYNTFEFSTEKFLKKKFNINKNDIIDIIEIYNKNIKLKIVIVNYDIDIKEFTFNIYFDLLKNNCNLDQEKIFENIYFYNLNHKNYLSSKINNNKNTIFIKLIDLYYYLIGYI